MQLNINTDKVVVFTNKLEKLHRSALPNAVRSALNSAAFDTKKNTLPKSADKEFINRQPNFFKAYSKVEMARGFDLKSMKATVGMVEQGLRGDNNYSVKDLEQQEKGGVIKGRSFIPVDDARTSGSNTKTVRSVNRIGKIENLVNAKEGKGKNRWEKFVRSSIHAGKGGYVLGNFERAILWRITSIRRKKGNTIIRKKPVYTFKEKRNVKVKSTKFMSKAALKSAEQLESFFIKEAKRQIEKLK